MAKLKRQLDANSALKKINFKGSKRFQQLAYKLAKERAAKIKKEVIEDFNNHPVTKEVAQGPKGMSSHLLGGSGNLFGFLGFEQGSKPVMILREVLRNSFEVNRQKMRVTSLKKNVFTVEFDVSIPTDQQIDSVTPLPWTTKSWVKGVEKGITNYSKTIFQPRKGVGSLYQTHSRSGVALQTDRSINFIKFTPTPYITEILKKARRNLR
tara:strand:- start:889 stop:1515 length:627 start_codon:yes stop_codon:yes gene_type:complete